MRYGKKIKKEWMKMPADCFEALTFGELKVGQKFIGLPIPGDNSGHAGFKASHRIFIKTCQRVTRAVHYLYYGEPYGMAVNISSGASSEFSNSMPVIIVE